MTSILKADTIQDTDGNNIINENSNTITIGASGDTTNIIGTLQNNGAAVGGLTMADQWRLTANISQPSGDITTNLERVDDASYGTLGTGMTESSGVFSFPSTGIYLVLVSACINYANQNDNKSEIRTIVTINNSSYDEVSSAVAGSNSNSNNSMFTVFSQTLIDVTDTSNVKVKFNADSFQTSVSLIGNTDQSFTSFSFIRLGDT